MVRTETKQTKTKRKSIAKSFSNVPNSQGLYAYMDENGNVIYIGKTRKLKQRLTQHINPSYTRKPVLRFVQDCSFYDYIPIEDATKLRHIEKALIKKYKPKYNKQSKAHKKTS